MRDKRLPHGQRSQYRGERDRPLRFLSAGDMRRSVGWIRLPRGRYAVARASFTSWRNRCGRGHCRIRS